MTDLASSSGPVAPPKVSRYQCLQGESVSELRSRDFNAGKENIVPLRTSSALDDGVLMARKRAKSVGHGNHVKDDFMTVPPLVPKVPSLPLSAKSPNSLWRKKSKTKLSSHARSGSLHETQTYGSVFSGGHHQVSPFGTPYVTRLDQPAPKSPSIRSNATVTCALTPQKNHDGSKVLRMQAYRRPGDNDEGVSWLEEIDKLERDIEEMLPGNRKKKDIAPLQTQTAMQQPVAPQPKVSRSPVLDRFPFLSLGRRSKASSITPSSSTGVSVLSSPREGSLEPSLLGDIPIEPLIVPSMEPPSRGGERRVLVRCRQISMSLPLSSSSTTLDILSTVSENLSSPIDKSTSIVVESYPHLGLERRLRLYERTRDVINSWDSDDQNALVILPLDSYKHDKDLDISSVPHTDELPRGFTLQLYHSHKPGKWSKRFVTLLETGHVYSSKKAAAAAAAQPDDRDAQLLCHMSDFDIYTPTEAQMRKYLKPPKRFCYAIKSQQKSALLEHGTPSNTHSNFVHFFSAEDKDIADKFYAGIHAWRSWYLVNRQLEMHRKTQQKILEDKPPQIAPRARVKPKKSISHLKHNGHQVKVSVDETPYSIGAFAPLLDIGRFDQQLGKFLPAAGESAQESSPSSPPPISQHPALAPLAPLSSPSGRGGTVVSATATTFAADSLLGDEYQRRIQNAVKEKGTPPSSPFTEGPTLLNASIQRKPSNEEEVEPRSWFPSAAEHTARLRSQSQSRSQHAAAASIPKPTGGIRPSTSSGTARQGLLNNNSSSNSSGIARPPFAPPLIDLDAHFQEPPQWSSNTPTRSGGRGIIAPQGMPLVDLATNNGNGNGNSAMSPTMARFLEAPPPPRLLARREVNVGQQTRPTTSDGPGAAGSGGSRLRSRSVSAAQAASQNGPHLARRGTASPAPPLPVPATPTGASLSRPGTRDGADSMRGRRRL